MIPAASQADAGPAASPDNNPAINLVIEGRFARYDEGHFEVPGFQLVSNEGIYQKGFSTGQVSNLPSRKETELSTSR